MTPQLGHAAPPATWQDVVRPGGRYAALPSRGRPLVIAEDDPGVLRYLRTALLTRPPRSRLPGWPYLLAGQGLRVPGVARLLPAALVAAPAGGQDRTELARFIDEGGWRLLVLLHSRDVDASCVLLLFPPRTDRPARAVKLACGPAAAARVHAEAARLAALAEGLGGHLGDGVPRVVDILDHRGLPALVTTAQPGVSMLVRYHRGGHTADRRSVCADLAAAERWLDGLQAASAGPARPMDLAPGTIERLAGWRISEPAAETVIDRLAGVQRRLRHHWAPTTWVHGDFWPGNLLVEGDEITGVVDWERSEQVGGPLRDRIRFVLGYAYYLDRHTPAGRRVRGHRGLVAGEPGAGVRYALTGAGWFPDAVRAFLARALAGCSLPAECARDAVLAEVAAVAAEASDPGFVRAYLTLFLALSETGP
ncbi:MAG: phosphotransferase family protein [Oryzihumus sp.]